MNASRKSKRISRDQWLRTALGLFARSGEEGLRVEKLARELDIAKSGFYWHFKDREDFLEKLLAYWSHEYTEVVTKNPLLLMAEPRQRLLMIMTLVFEQNLIEFDAAMQVWSNKDPAIAKKVRKVVDMRLRFISTALRELGFEGDDLTMRARTFLGYITSERQIFGPNKAASSRCREHYLDMLLAKAGTTKKKR
jgi:AcrR family transcriptional regulator